VFTSNNARGSFLPDQPAALFLSLRPVYQDALKRFAAELGVTESDAAARLVEQGLEPFLELGVGLDQAKAERQLIDLAASLAKQEVARSPDWNERLTLAVFERIRNEHRPLYDLAISSGRRDAVNRRIARQIKAATGAQVKKRKGRPVALKVPRGADALIGDYTLLLPPSS
jgi:hypothetical protein